MLEQRGCAAAWSEEPGGAALGSGCRVSTQGPRRPAGRAGGGRGTVVRPHLAVRPPARILPNIHAHCNHPAPSPADVRLCAIGAITPIMPSFSPVQFAHASSNGSSRRKAMRHRSNHAHYAVFSPVQFAHASSNGSSVEPNNSFAATSASSSVTHRKKRPCWSIGHTVSCRAMASPLWSFWHRRCVRLH